MLDYNYNKVTVKFDDVLGGIRQLQAFYLHDAWNVFENPWLHTSLPIRPSFCDVTRQWAGLSTWHVIVRECVYLHDIPQLAKHVVCHVNEHIPESRKENTLSLLTGLGKGYCCMRLP